MLPSTKTHCTLALLCSIAVVDRVAAEDVQWSGSAELETRAFAQTPAQPEQFDWYSVSLSLAPEFSYRPSAQYSIQITPFLRVDQRDPDRTHADLREAAWTVEFDSLTLRLGLAHVFWGVLESKHLVDIINQTDALEDLDGETKLGQPMLQLSERTPLGTFELFVMSGFRERVYPGRLSRLRFALPIQERKARFESDLKHAAPDVALRWSNSVGPFDVGLAYFYGTSREPQLQLGGTLTEPTLVPYYDRIHQGSIDVQATLGAILLKAEAMVRQGQGALFGAASGGFEYTFVGAVGDTDIGVLGEYHYDGRTNATPEILKNDVFGALRLSFNDTQSSSLLIGAFFDLARVSHVINLEASRRWGETRKVSLRGRLFMAEDPADILYSFRRDSYLQANVQWFF